MTKILCGKLISDTIDGIVLEKKKNIFLFKERKSLSIDNIKNLDFKVYASINLPEYIIHKVYIPPVKDKKSQELLVKNKLSTIVEEDLSNYIVKIFEAGIENESLTVNVVLIKKDYIPNYSQDILERFEIFSTDAFGLATLSTQIEKNKYVFHFYSCSKYTLAVLSKGSYIEYIRYSPVPDYIFSEKDIENFYYESFNLTYLYLKQNQSINLDLIVFSGDIVSMDDVLRQLYEFSNLPFASINYKYFVQNIPEDIAFEQTSSIGLIISPEEFDIRNIEIIYSRRFKILSKYLSLVVAIINAFMGIVLILNLYSLKESMFLRNYKETLLENKVNVLKKTIKYNHSELNYFISYAKLYSTVYEHTFFDIMKDIKDLLKFYPYKTIRYIRTNQGHSVSLVSTVSFHSLLDLDNFNKKLINILNRFKDKYKVANKSSIDVNNLTIHIDINISKGR